VTNKKQITFTINGIVTTDFEFTPDTGIFKATAIIQKGNNTIMIKAVTDSGEAQDSVKVGFL
jgi:hypothetical protein